MGAGVLVGVGILRIIMAIVQRCCGSHAKITVGEGVFISLRVSRIAAIALRTSLVRSGIANYVAHHLAVVLPDPETRACGFAIGVHIACLAAYTSITQITRSTFYEIAPSTIHSVSGRYTYPSNI